MLQSWRANVDFQMLIYDNHPDHILATDVDVHKVTNYVVKYATKASETQLKQKNSIKNFVMDHKPKLQYTETDKQTNKQIAN